VIDNLLDDLVARMNSDTLHPMTGVPMPRYDLLKKNRYVNCTFVQTRRPSTSIH
jgi:hypothetical protein